MGLLARDYREWVTESVQELEIGVVWDPNAPGAVLIRNDVGASTLALLPRWDDEDARSVVLCWSGVVFMSAGPPNDEAISRHRLHGKGLEDVTWIGHVIDSDLMASVASMIYTSSAPKESNTHYVVLTKESTIEVVAQSLAVRRIVGQPDVAAVEALSA